MPPISPAAVLLGMIVAPQVIQGMLSTYPPFSSGMARKGYKEDPNLITPPSDLIGQVQKDIIGEGKFIELMRQAGYSQTMAENMLKNARTYLSALDYITAMRRGVISDSAVTDILKQQGLSDTDIGTLKEVTLYYPTPQDLVRFAVRDVYSPDTVAAYGIDQDYPALLDATAYKAGLPPEIAKQYWMAHWELPSPTQVYEMMHRGVISESDVAVYLKTADYMPYWRDKLIAISYDPLTRVDVRRMYAMGVLSESEVTRAYLDLGYNQQNAERLTRFTVLETQHTQESTPASTIIAAYKNGTYGRGQAEQALLNSKVPMDTAMLMLDTADGEIKQELINLEADSIVDQYQKGLITIDQVNSLLTGLGVPARLLQLTVQRELAQARRRAKTSSKSDLDSWWIKGVIGNNIYIDKLSMIGYAGKDIGMFLAELKLEYLAGADKKYPWAPILRDYSDKLIDDATLDQELKAVTEDPEIIATLKDIAYRTHI